MSDNNDIDIVDRLRTDPVKERRSDGSNLIDIEDVQASMLDGAYAIDALRRELRSVTKPAPAEYMDVLQKSRSASGWPGRQFALIGIDGYPASGKSHLAAWLSWQLDCPAYHLDEFRTERPDYDLNTDILKWLIKNRKKENRPVIVEGLMLLDAMKKADLCLDLHIWAQIDHDTTLDFSDQVWSYTQRKREEQVIPDHVCRIAHFCDTSGQYSRAWNNETSPAEQDPLSLDEEM